MKTYEYYKPQTIDEAIDLMVKLEDARFIAGGTDLLVLLKQKKIALKNLISLRNIKDLAVIERRDSGLWIGGGTTHSSIEKDEFIKKYYCALNDAVSNIGSRQIRNVATIGGNICNAAPSADTACPLLVFDAMVTIAEKREERDINMDTFFIGPNKTVLEKGEVVKGFKIPPFRDNSGSAYTKHTRRQAMDLPLLGIAVSITVSRENNILRCEDARIAMGVVAPRPVRAKKAEEALKNSIITGELLDGISEIAASEANPRDSVRGEAWYRKEMVKVLTKRTILKAIERISTGDYA